MGTTQPPAGPAEPFSAAVTKDAASSADPAPPVADAASPDPAPPITNPAAASPDAVAGSPPRRGGEAAAAAGEPVGDDIANFGRGALHALAASQAALARGLEALSAEMAGLTISGIDAAARTATDMLAIKTLSDAIAVNAGFARNSFDTMVNSSARLSGIGVKLAADATLPILAQLTRGWTRANQPGT
jgi:hypothetical protein